MTQEQFYMVLVAGIAFFSVLVYLFERQFQQNRDVIKSLTDALIQVQASPIAMENAKAAGNGVPQPVFDKLYVVLNAALQLLGPNTPLGTLAEQAKELAERVDHDATNDPAPDSVKGVPVTPAVPAQSGDRL